MVSPMSVQLVAAVVQVVVPGLEVPTYAVTAEPPLNAGVQEMTDELFEYDDPTTLLGGVGVVDGVAVVEAIEGAPVPILFIATTVNR